MLNSPIEEIKNRLDIVEVIGSYIKLEKAGANYRALCPFHSEKTPSFFISPSRQIWHCFGACGEGGDIFKFVMKIEGVEFGDALRILAKKAGIELKRESPKLKTERQRLYEISEISAKFFETQLRESLSGKKAKKYLFDRGIKEETIKKWRLGYSPDTWQGLSDFLIGRGYKREEIERAGLSLKSLKTGSYYDRFRGRIIFPIFNLSSQVVGFGGRVFDTGKGNPPSKEAKYINSPGTLLYDKSSILYGLDKAGKAIREKDTSILVEGYMDVLMVSQGGMENVVATSGTALTPYQLKILKRYSNNLLTAFDMDIAGNSATKRGINLAQNFGFNIKVVEMPEGLDPADVVLKSSEKFKSLIKKAESIHDFYFKSAFSNFDKNSLEGKKKISEILIPIIKKIPNKIEEAVWIKDLADGLGVKEKYISEELRKVSSDRSDDSIRSREGNYTFSGSANGEKTKKEEKKKTRKELLEDRLAMLLVKSPENINLLKEDDFKFFSLKISQLFRYIKEKGVGPTKNVSAELDSTKNSQEEGIQEKDGLVEINELLDYFSLKSDIENIEKEEAEEEINSCLEEMRKLAIKEELDEISQKIRKAEQKRDVEKIDELVKKFNERSKLIH